MHGTHGGIAYRTIVQVQHYAICCSREEHNLDFTVGFDFSNDTEGPSSSLGFLFFAAAPSSSLVSPLFSSLKEIDDLAPWDGRASETGASLIGVNTGAAATRSRP